MIPGWAPFLIGIASITATILLWQAQVDDQTNDICNKIKTRAVHIENLIVNEFDSQAPRLIRLAKRWDMGGKPTKEIWASDATLYVNHHPSLLSLQWVDENYHIQWIVPYVGNEELQDHDIRFEKDRIETIARARVTRKMSVSRTVNLKNGEKGFLIYFPLYPENKFNGFIIAVFNIERIVNNVLERNISNDVSVDSFEEDIFNIKNSTNKVVSDKWSIPITIDFHGNSWKFLVHPTAEFIERQHSFIPTAIIIIGIMGAFILSLFVHIAIRANRFAKKMKFSNKDLEKEISNRLLTEEALKKAHNELEHRVEERTRNLFNEVKEREKVEEDLKKSKEKAEKSAELKKGLSDLYTTMQGEYDMVTLSNNIVQYIARFLKIPLAALFVLNRENVYQRVASWGYPDNKNKPDRFESGTGFIGKAAKDVQPILIKDIPDNIKVVLGFGEIVPSVVLVYPLVYNNQVVGVLESGSLKEFSIDQCDWIKEAANSIAVVLRTNLDATERKKAEAAVKESEERFALAVRGSGDGLWEYDVSTSKYWLSPRFKEMLNYNEDELSDSLDTWKSLVHPEDIDSAVVAFTKHLEKDAPYDIEYRMQTKDGRYLWFHTRAKSLRNEQGEALRVSGSVTDITEQKDFIRALLMQNLLKKDKL